MIEVGARAAGSRLDDLLARELALVLSQPPARSDIRRLIMAGAVTHAGRTLRRPGALLTAGTSLRVALRPDKLTSLADRQLPALTARDILYDDGVLLGVRKPAGLPTVPTADPSRASLVSLVSTWLSGQNRPLYLGVHHRLDRDTSGIVLFAIDPAVNASVGRAFEAHVVAKTYHALTVRPPAPPPERWAVRNEVEPAGRGRASRTRATRSGLYAETLFRRLRILRHALLVEARPITGRKHQVRAHLAGMGLPILGDRRYGAPRANAPSRAMLHAYRLELPHPVTGRPLRLTCPYPADFARLAGERSYR